MNNKPIYVTQPNLPELSEFIPYLEKIWNNKVLTNGGPFHVELENELAKYLGVKYVSLFSNATIALVTALQALEITGEVITTPYSFVATAHSIIWNNLEPVFVDIESDGYNIDVTKIEQAITDKTSAIMPVHCYGYPCQYDKIKDIADRHNLKVIYDAAHAFGVQDNNGSVLNHGDLSILSFHATKVFNTFEGGAIICNTPEMKKKIDQLKNFGFVDEVTVVAAGINGKMSEVNAAFGLLQLSHLEKAVKLRRKISEIYDAELSGIQGVKLLSVADGVNRNYSYYPLLITEDFPCSRDSLYNRMKEENIFARRYFYPLISDFPMYKNKASSQKENLPRAGLRSQQVICLPLYPTMTIADVTRVIDIIKGEVK
nr:DegT/DnrJ/EryC1/StrS family aminotransferase [Kluyvera genomosp. 1]